MKQWLENHGLYWNCHWILIRFTFGLLVYPCKVDIKLDSVNILVFKQDASAEENGEFDEEEEAEAE